MGQTLCFHLKTQNFTEKKRFPLSLATTVKKRQTGENLTEMCLSLASRFPLSCCQQLETHQSGVLGAHAGSLHQELLVSQLHAVQPGNSLQRYQRLFTPSWNKLHWCTFFSVVTHYLIIQVDVNIFTESVSFRQACGAVFHQIKGLQRAKWCQQFFHLEKHKVLTLSHIAYKYMIC